MYYTIKNKIQAAVAIKISNLIICFCSFDLSCPILEKENFIKTLYIVSLNSVLFFNLVCFDLDKINNNMVLHVLFTFIINI